MGEDAGAYFKETELIHHALEIGYRVFDTAEMYGQGGAEEVLGTAIADCRKKVFLVSKVSPTATSYEQIIESCEKSLERLRTDHLDLYLLYRGCCRNNLEDALEAFIDLKKDGRILNFGVSYADLNDLKEWFSYDEAAETALNQIYFNPCHRRLENELLPFCQKMKIPLITYSPLDICSIAYKNQVLCNIAKAHDITPRQTILAWLLAKKNVGISIKALNKNELQEYFNAQFICLASEEIDAINALFPLC